MAQTIKIIDTNFIEHEFMVYNYETDIKVSEKNDERFKEVFNDASSLSTQDIIDEISFRDLSLKDFGFDKNSIVEEYLNYDFNIIEAVEDLLTKNTSKTEKKIDKILKLIEDYRKEE